MEGRLLDRVECIFTFQNHVTSIYKEKYKLFINVYLNVTIRVVPIIGSDRLILVISVFFA